MVGKRLVNTGGAAGAAAFDALQNFEVVTYTGNSGTQKITGYIRKGAAFNGSSSSLDIESLDLIQNQIESFSFWFRGKFIFGFYDPSSASTSDRRRWFIENVTTGSIKIQVNNDQYNYEQTGITEDSDWHHLAVVSDGKIYLDGTQLTNTFNTSYWITDGTNGTQRDTIRIGSADFIGAVDSSYIAGSYDQIRFFNTALNSTQVEQLAAEDYTDPKKSTTDYFGDGSGVALYELDEDANSSNFEQAAVFNGSSSKISSTTPVPNGSNYTFSFWFKADSNPNSNRGVIKTNRHDYAGVFQFLHTTNGNGYFAAGNGSNSESGQTTTANITDGTWKHIVCTYDSAGGSSSGKTYINGSLDSSWNAAAQSPSDGIKDMTFGARYSTGGAYLFYLNGQLDQVRIYDTALSSGDVTNLYNESSVPTANLVAHYKLDGDATDEQGSYDGTETSITYSAGVYGGTPTNVNFLGMAFQPDLVWLKSRNPTGYSSALYDTVRGATLRLVSNTTDANVPSSTGLTSFDSNGFTLGGSNTSGNAASTNYVAWCWKAGGAAVSNTDGSITSSVSANQDAGFSIVKYTGNATAGATVGHGLSSAPEMIIVKDLDQAVDWAVYHIGTDAISPEDYKLELNTTDARIDQVGAWNDTQPNATTFTLGGGGVVSTLNNDYIAYCFHSVDGYQKVGSFVGDGSTDTVLNLGFEPRWIMIKNTNTTTGWFIMDVERSDFALRLRADTEAQESSIGTLTTSATGITISSNSSDGRINGRPSQSDTMIYLAIA